MYQRIFVGLDGGPSARVALNEAIRIAAASGGTITCAYVVERRPQLVDVDAGFAEARDDDAAAIEAATSVLDDAKATLARRGVPGTVRALDAYGDDVATVLMRTAAELDADLIVLGTSGRHGLRRLLLGSVAESLLRAADRPVLLVRHAESAASAAA
ncbi:universal stress protein [Burkholderia dolosa]|jgi:nucleotide-binding universal stress UspA family protein|uniref:Universal stress protein n=1 Tax=Burkholderia dolosa TaxID=152500 RepID=A0A892IAV7_9BURK|nr:MULTISPECIES: universal stress protein [Burkholderia]AKE05900.1 universal stress protein UspA [Burkholderia cepacia]AJY10344.1 universal stress family protein [Burkholderia dolosa AU0158]AYZ93771.1 universal stress protein [Burkholderia dolosa]EAY70503.1 Universal stress protein UspA [Burkholderia dolosa AU0158]ETP62505.1 universal stress protein A [Burkholderia dolosa PC543]